MRKIGFFGGSFDPIHLGHLNAIVRIKEHKKLDHVYVCPVNCSPYKTENPPIASGEDRLNMINIALHGLEGVSSLDIELKREGPSYTFDSIKELIGREGAHYYLILSEDTTAHLEGWKSIEELLLMATPLIIPRSSKSAELNKKYINYYHSLPLMEISSTEIRSRLNKRVYCRHLLIDKVLDYIYSKDLYF
ncbi:MAG: nicotinate (nicotinamide) nucleotide adenylyltransferase [Simkaniaceae bacterium]